MAYDPKFNFAAGEITPELHERTNLDKYQNGLKLARNFAVTKVGTLLSMPGTNYYKTFASRTKYFPMMYTNFIIYIRNGEIGYINTSTGVVTLAIAPIVTYTAAQLDQVQVSMTQSKFVYFSCPGTIAQQWNIVDNIFNSYPRRFGVVITVPLGATTATPGGAPAGYSTQYIGSIISLSGEESALSPTPATGNRPISTGQSQTLTVSIVGAPTQAALTQYVKAYFYLRPANAGEYLFLGASTAFTDIQILPAGTWNRTFTLLDFGQDADVEHIPPADIPDWLVDNTNPVLNNNYSPTSNIVYQDRVVMGGMTNQGLCFATRPSLPFNMTREYPISPGSALAMKPAAEGNLKISRFANMGGLAALTSQGIFVTPAGGLVPETAYMTRKGNWVVQEDMPPLEIPGAWMIVDKYTNAVMELRYSEEGTVFVGSEVSIFSNHLFEKRKATSWCYQEGEIPIVWITFNDGQAVAFTYQDEQLMRAWTRKNTDGHYHQVFTHRDSNGVQTIYYHVLRNGSYLLEKLTEFRTDDIKDYVAMESTVGYNGNLNTGATYTFAPVIPAAWSGLLTVTASVPSFANTAGNGAMGSNFRAHFDDGSWIDLVVGGYISTTQLYVEPQNGPYPEEHAVIVNKLYKTVTTITGLAHLNGKKVSVLLDGTIEGSPLNVQDGYPEYTVSGGQITFEDDRRGSVVHVGLPYACDVQFLDVDTVEQKPVLLESVNAKRMNIKVYQSNGFWVGNEFPEDDTNSGMYNPMTEQMSSDDIDEPDIAERSLIPETVRKTFDINGDWKSHGSICIRKVDPTPFELLSSIPDLEIHTR